MPEPYLEIANADGRRQVPVTDKPVTVGRHSSNVVVVMDGQATFYNKEHQPTVLNKGEGIMLPENHYYYFQSTGEKPLALFRVSAKKGNKPKVVRVDAEGNKRADEEIDFVVVDGQVVEGQFWELK